MAVNGKRQSKWSQRSLVVSDLLTTLLIPILLLLTSAPCTRSQGANVRLAGGTSSEGRLEVYYNGSWGTVCDDTFDYIDAGVVCNSLGFGYRGRAIGNRYGPGTGPILLDDVRCVGNEISIADCPHRGWRNHNCDHSEDVSVSCGTSPVQYVPLSNADNFFIVADSYMRNLYQVDASSGATAQLLPFGVASNPLAVAYDPTAKLIYWTDVSLQTINRYSLLTNTSTVIYRDPSNTAVYDGLAIDVGRQKLYYADAATGAGKVGELSTDGTGHRVLYSDVYSSPRAVVIDVDNRQLYWTDWSATRPAIYRSSVVNPARETLVIGSLRWPNALAINFTAGVMYWGDASLTKIETAYLNGSSRRTLLTETNGHYFGFVLRDGDIYFTDWRYVHIRRMNISTRSLSVIYSATSFQRLNGIIFVSDAGLSRQSTTVATTTSTTTTTTSTTTTTTTSPRSSTTATSSTTPNPESATFLSETLLIVITTSVVGGIVIIVIVIVIAIVACICVSRKRQQQQQQQQQQHYAPLQGYQPQQPQSVIAGASPVYLEIDYDYQKNDTYELPNFNPAAAVPSHYERLTTLQ